LNACWLRVVVVLAFTEDKTMATYVYETIPKDPKKKPRQFEVQQKMSDPPLTKDPETGEPVRRVITGGSGWVTHGASILSMNTRKGRR
jgi:predicted nucleic acid-binding Zn ribbon protein